MQLLALEVLVVDRGYSRLRASGEHPFRRSLQRAQEVEGLCGGLVIEEVPDRRERTDMSHV
jgi:hypothetical protein